MKISYKSLIIVKMTKYKFKVQIMKTKNILKGTAMYIYRKEEQKT